MPEEHFTREDSFAIIDSMINKARNQFSENGHLYLLWGWVVLFCSAGHFIMQVILQLKYFYIPWLLTWPTLAYQFFYLRKKIKSSRVRTYTDEIMGYVWMVFIVCTVLMVFLLSARFTSRDYQTTIWLVMYGMPTFLSGVILRYKGLMAGGICCWVLAIASYFVPVQYHMLLLSAAVICGWILPGYGMRQKFKIQNAIAA